MASELLDRSWTAVPPSVPDARHAVMRHLSEASTPDPPLNDIGVAVSEAVTNAVHHAYVDRDPGAVRVRVELSEYEIEVVVEDDGTGMRPRPDSPGLGLGMPMINDLASRLEIANRDRGGTELRMRFALGPRSA